MSVTLNRFRPARVETSDTRVVDPKIIKEASDSMAPQIREFTSRMAREIGAKVEAEINLRHIARSNNP